MKRNRLMVEAAAVLRSAASKGFCCGEMCELERRMRHAFSVALCNGIGIVPEPLREYAGGVLHTVITLNQVGEESAVVGVSITCFTDGVLTTLDIDAEENIICRYQGTGKVFKFLWHNPTQLIAKPRDFFGEGFLYEPNRLALSAVHMGTVACVRGAANTSFMTSGLCLVSESRIEDIRHYPDQGKLDYDLRVLYEEMTSGDEEERGHVLSLLASA
ncbi:MAG: hypothetical protein ACD_81C00217G0018 [uncultured bacterium]|uniref:Uncharacterized protein n=2 Tax=Candidatus Wolfeibacteriota TaxID=1752735 RepID=A0A0G1HB30_9BACT|nr:MAG: hypothetical protein ACD_81C00217G0018 [uncultured bacterium]KKR12792.1 MAG: hypothetical protein UT41_C0001G0336 [Candidatus Wolfebacteria bacterium GW2011_GWC2_39_22]KKT43723.1 MAG: hypothetical protein UW32_C0001G0315 [Candidatus Wolfebacteria bacterium GW2011_GWE2_44_13]HBI25546.1 hypothetical protein [Candidatus Wolfebacteria bacterium]